MTTYVVIYSIYMCGFVHIFVYLLLLYVCMSVCAGVCTGGVVKLLAFSLSVSLPLCLSSLQLVPDEPSQGTGGEGRRYVPDNDLLPSAQHP